MNPANVTYLYGSYRFEWPEEGISILVSRLSEERAGLNCEITVSTSLEPMPGLLRQGRFNLSAAQTRVSWEKALDTRLPGIDWYAAIEQVCALSIARWRQGEPAVDLLDVRERPGLPFLLPPFVVEGAASLLFAEGGAGKSMFALACGLAVATGNPDILGVTPSRVGPVLYLDWEWDAESHAERLRALCRGYSIDLEHGRLFYRRETTSLAEGAETIREHIAATGAIFAIVDSLGMARGGEPESADLTIKAFAAIRTLGITVLVLDHVVKAQGVNSKYSFGSVYTTNAARLTWRMDSSGEGNGAGYRIGLSNQKSNGKYQQPRGYAVTVQSNENDEMTAAWYAPTDVLTVPGMEKRVPLRQNVIGILKERPLEKEELMKELTGRGVRTTAAVLTTTLNRNKDDFVLMGGAWCLTVERRRAEAETT